MSDKLNGIFDQGFSGILNDEDLKEAKVDDSDVEALFQKEPEKEEDDFQKTDDGVKEEKKFEDLGLTRANDLSNDGIRDVESRKVEAKDFRKEIEKSVEDLLSVGTKPKDIEKTLTRKFPRSQVKKYFEANSNAILNQYGKVAAKYLKSISYKESKKLEDALREHQHRLKKEAAFEVCTSFLDYAEMLKRQQQRRDPDFKRDIDQKEMKERNVDNNKVKNAKRNEQKQYNEIFQEFKNHVQSGLNKKEAQKKLLQSHKPTVVETFLDRYSSKIDKLVHFNDRQAFDTDFGKVQKESKDLDVQSKENKDTTYDDKKMFQLAYKMMMNGTSLRKVQRELKKSFQYKDAKRFIEENKRKLEKHYGQLGYVFIDSNIFDSCIEMKKAYTDIQHIGKELIYSVKANKKCKGCVENKQGSCTKVDLMISNHPIVRSSRAMKRVLQIAEGFVPKAYVESVRSKISSDNNMSLVSEFTLGLKEAIDSEKKNIGKKASVQEKPLEAQEAFKETVTPQVDLFKKSTDSKIIDDVISG